MTDAIMSASSDRSPGRRLRFRLDCTIQTLCARSELRDFKGMETKPPSNIWIFSRIPHSCLQERHYSRRLEKFRSFLRECIVLFPTTPIELEICPMESSSEGRPTSESQGIGGLLQQLQITSQQEGIQPPLRSLKLLRMNLTSEEGKEENLFLQYLSHLSCLEHFTCDDCPISDPNALGKVLASLPSLRHIQISHNDPWVEGELLDQTGGACKIDCIENVTKGHIIVATEWAKIRGRKKLKETSSREYSTTTNSDCHDLDFCAILSVLPEISDVFSERRPSKFLDLDIVYSFLVEHPSVLVAAGTSHDEIDS